MSHLSKNLAILTFGSIVIGPPLAILNISFPQSLILYITTLIIFISYNINKKVILKNAFRKYDLLFFLFLFSIIFSYLTHDFNENSTKKIISFFYLIATPVSLIYIYFSSIKKINTDEIKKNLLFFSKVILALSIIYVLTGYTKFVEDSDKITIWGIDNTIWFSRAVALAILILIISTTDYRKNKIILLYLSIGFYLLYISGSRGASLSLALSIVYFYLKPNKTFSIFLSISLMILLILNPIDYIEKYFISNIDYTSGRVDLYKISIDILKENFIFGIGYGNFGDYTPTGDYYYPHNIFLEIWTECGIIPLFIFILLMYKTIIDLKQDYFYNTLLIFLFMNSQFSGDMNGNYLLFIYISIRLNIHKLNERNRE